MGLDQGKRTASVINRIFFGPLKTPSSFSLLSFKIEKVPPAPSAYFRKVVYFALCSVSKKNSHLRLISYRFEPVVQHLMYS